MSLRFVMLAGLMLVFFALPVRAGEFPLFDAHIHYSHDAWQRLTPEEAVRRLRAAGVRRALVSSSNDDGTRMLYWAAPDLVVPALRPYRKRSDLSAWTRDESIPAYLEERLGQHRYVAIGEFHVDGTEADTPVVRRVVQLASQHGLMLHVHGDADAIARIFRQDPEARILWAHAGFEGVDTVARMLALHPRLWADLSFRGEIAPKGKLRPEWRALFLTHPDRFMVGTDTYTPARWDQVGEHADWARSWLAELPPEVAAGIAWRNGEAVIATAFTARPAAAGGP